MEKKKFWLRLIYSISIFFLIATAILIVLWLSFPVIILKVLAIIFEVLSGLGYICLLVVIETKK